MQAQEGDHRADHMREDGHRKRPAEVAQEGHGELLLNKRVNDDARRDNQHEQFRNALDGDGVQEPPSVAEEPHNHQGEKDAHLF